MGLHHGVRLWVRAPGGFMTISATTTHPSTNNFSAPTTRFTELRTYLFCGGVQRALNGGDRSFFELEPTLGVSDAPRSARELFPTPRADSNGRLGGYPKGPKSRLLI